MSRSNFVKLLFLNYHIAGLYIDIFPLAFPPKVSTPFVVHLTTITQFETSLESPIVKQLPNLRDLVIGHFHHVPAW